MDYIRQVNAFYDWLETNHLSHPCIVLWHALMHAYSKTDGQREFTVSVSTLEQKTGLNRRAIERARKILEEKGLIRWRKRSGSQSAIYEIIQFGEKFVRQNDIQFVVQNDDYQKFVRQNDVDFVAQTQFVRQNEAQFVAQSDVQISGKTPEAAPEAESENADIGDLFTPLYTPININNLNSKKHNSKKGDKKQKREYREFVHMTEEEYHKLVERFGEEFTERCLDVLNSYKGSKGKRYKSDYHAILYWVVERVKEEKAREEQREKNRRGVGRRFDDYDYDSLSL